MKKKIRDVSRNLKDLPKVKFKSDTCENPFSFPELRGF